VRRIVNRKYLRDTLRARAPPYHYRPLCRIYRKRSCTCQVIITPPLPGHQEPAHAHVRSAFPLVILKDNCLQLLSSANSKIKFFFETRSRDFEKRYFCDTCYKMRITFSSELILDRSVRGSARTTQNSSIDWRGSTSTYQRMACTSDEAEGT